MTHEIVSIDDKNRQIDSPYDEDTVDDAIEILDREYLEIDGEEFIIVDDDELFSFREMDGEAPFYRGRNC